MPWLRLIRWKNLLIILLTQLIAWWCVVLPEGPVVLGVGHFALIACSTVLIAAAGYIINDYFDIRIDSINKPDEVILENVIPRKQAIIMHFALNTIALIMAGYVAFVAGHLQLVAAQLLCTLLLWYYSTHFKRQYVTGNVVVALLTALTIVILVLYEPALRDNKSIVQNGRDYMLARPGWVLAMLAYFAFMLTWVREIVKDMEDIKGDSAENCVTMPIVRGLSYASWFSIVLAALVIIPLVIAATMLLQQGEVWLPTYLFLMLVLPLTAWAAVLRRASTSSHYHTASRRLKIIMVLGIVSLIIYHFQ